jgi:hypothetical protein
LFSETETVRYVQQMTTKPHTSRSTSQPFGSYFAASRTQKAGKVVAVVSYWYWLSELRLYIVKEGADVWILWQLLLW